MKSPTNAFEDAEIAREELADLIEATETDWEFSTERPIPRADALAAAILAAGFTRQSSASTTAAELAETKRLLLGLDSETNTAKTIRQVHELAATTGMSHDWALNALRVINSAQASAWDACIAAIDKACIGSHVGMVENPYRVAAPEGDGGNEQQ